MRLYLLCIILIMTCTTAVPLVASKGASVRQFRGPKNICYTNERTLDENGREIKCDSSGKSTTTNNSAQSQTEQTPYDQTVPSPNNNNNENSNSNCKNNNENSTSNSNKNNENSNSNCKNNNENSNSNCKNNNENSNSNCKTEQTPIDQAVPSPNNNNNENSNSNCKTEQTPIDQAVPSPNNNNNENSNSNCKTEQTPIDQAVPSPNNNNNENSNSNCKTEQTPNDQAVPSPNNNNNNNNNNENSNSNCKNNKKNSTSNSNNNNENSNSNNNYINTNNNNNNHNEENSVVLDYKDSYGKIITDLRGNWVSPINYLIQRGYLPKNALEEISKISNQFLSSNEATEKRNTHTATEQSYIVGLQNDKPIPITAYDNLKNIINGHQNQTQNQQLHDQQVRDQQLHDQQLHDQQLHDQQLHDQQLHDQQLHDQQLHDQQLHDEELHDDLLYDQQLQSPQLQNQNTNEKNSIKAEQFAYNFDYKDILDVYRHSAETTVKYKEVKNFEKLYNIGTNIHKREPVAEKNKTLTATETNAVVVSPDNKDEIQKKFEKQLENAVNEFYDKEFSKVLEENKEKIKQKAIKHFKLNRFEVAGNDEDYNEIGIKDDSSAGISDGSAGNGPIAFGDASGSNDVIGEGGTDGNLGADTDANVSADDDNSLDDVIVPDDFDIHQAIQNILKM